MACIATYDDGDVSALLLYMVDFKGPTRLNELDLVVRVAVEHDNLISECLSGYLTS